ncbi:MAG: TIGR04282 family arsenosugar biosynthesis glycosyltransferase [Deltaproteobacteria bacterium]
MGYSGARKRCPEKERLIVFTRYPEAGRTKTRLIPVLGIHGAAELHRNMTEHTMGSVRALTGLRSVSVEVRYEGGNRDLMAGWLGRDLSYRKQGPGDLGDRQALAFEEAFKTGMARVILIGTDCPARNEHDIQQGFDALTRHDLVLGPANDGGYHLIGLGIHFPPLGERKRCSNAPWPWLTSTDFPPRLLRRGMTWIVPKIWYSGKWRAKTRPARPALTLRRAIHDPRTVILPSSG